MAKPDLDEHEASGSLFYPQSEHIHKFGCRDVHVFGMLPPTQLWGLCNLLDVLYITLKIYKQF